MSVEPLDEDRQCRANSRRSGERCKRWAIRGGTVCNFHGGATPVVKAAAQRRLDRQAAQGMLGQLWSGRESAVPVKDPVDAMERLAGSLQVMVDEAGARLNDLGAPSDGRDLELFKSSIGHLRQLLVSMQQLGLTERAVELEQAKAHRVVAALQEAMAAAELEPEQRDLMVTAFLAGIGRPVPVAGSVVAGELG